MNNTPNTFCKELQQLLDDWSKIDVSNRIKELCQELLAENKMNELKCWITAFEHQHEQVSNESESSLLKEMGYINDD